MPDLPPVTSGRFTPGVSGNPKGRPRKDANHAEAQATGTTNHWWYNDGWQNVYTGIGVTGVDKRKGGTWAATVGSWEEYREVWRSSPVAARMVSIWPDEMTREGFKLRSDDPQFNKQVQARWEDLGLIPKLKQALEYQRAYGGGAILLGVNDGQAMDQPLNMDAVITLDFLTVFEARELNPKYYYGDPFHPKYREVEVYEINTNVPGMSRNSGVNLLSNVMVHESRLLVFDGVRVSRQITGESNGWGDSIFVRANSIIDDFEAACAALGILITDFSIPVYKMVGLYQMVAAQGAEAGVAFATRMKAMELGRSIAGARMIDAQDDFERKTTQVAGLGDLWDRMTGQLAMVADLPLTRLMGESPGGLNATGASDIRTLYDRVKAKQASDMRPPVEKVVKVIIRSLGLAEPEDWTVYFCPLWQETEKEEADTRFTQAQTDEKYWNMGVLSSKEIRENRFQSDENMHTAIDDDDTEVEPTPEEKATLRDPAGGTPAPVAGAPVTAAPENVQTQAMNGAQIASAWDIIKSVHAGEAPRESAIAALPIFFPTITKETAAAMLGPESFKAKEDPAPVAPGFGAPATKIPPSPEDATKKVEDPTFTTKE